MVPLGAVLVDRYSGWVTFHFRGKVIVQGSAIILPDRLAPEQRKKDRFVIPHLPRVKQQ